MSEIFNDENYDDKSFCRETSGSQTFDLSVLINEKVKNREIGRHRNIRKARQLIRELTIQSSPNGFPIFRPNACLYDSEKFADTCNWDKNALLLCCNCASLRY